MHKNDIGPITVSFDRFEITAGKPRRRSRPSITGTRPGAGQTGVPRDTFIAADVLLPTTGGVNAATLTAQREALPHQRPRARPGQRGHHRRRRRDRLQPTVLLDANTQLHVRDHRRPEGHHRLAFLPFATTFTTGTRRPAVDPTLSFEKVAAPEHRWPASSPA